MNNVQAIIDKRGGLEALKDNPIHIENPGWMPLNIEYIGTGPRGLPAIAVSHTYFQEGDVMRDPEIVFEISELGWGPIEYRQDNLGLYQELVWNDENGKTMIKPKAVSDVKSFAKLWNKNIKDQGFVRLA